MGKHSKKTKGPQRPQADAGELQNGMSRIASQIEAKLNGNPYKRKNPPTEASGKQKQRKQREPEAAPPAKGSKADEDALRAEIKALGGDEEDWRLINEVASDDEAIASESKAPVDKRLKDELAALSKELGFAELAPPDASDEEEEEEEEEDDDDNEDEEQENVKADAGRNKTNGTSNSKSAKEPQEKGPKENDMRRVEGLIFEPRADWHAARLAALPAPTVDDVGPFMSAINSLKEHGKYLLETEAAKYRTTIFASSSHKFLATIMTSGTLTDKISALTLACQESPVHNIRAFDTLMNLASKKSRAQALEAIGALVDMLGPGTLLPSDRRLKTFQAQPGLLGTLQRTSVKTWAPGQPLPGKITQAHLIYWAYEDWLKETYFKIIQLLEVWCSDEIEYSRTKALDFVYALLKDKPEQESNLLTLLVNKLGDRDRKISSRASYLLLQLQNSHPGMKPVIVRTVEQEILLRPSQDHRARYYAINTLNQTILSSKEPAVAESLLRIYFDLFATILKTGKLGMPIEDEAGKGKKPGKGPSSGKQAGQKKPAAASVPEAEAADKLVSALLTGVNRAAPFVGTNDMIMERHLDTLFKIAHSSNFNTGIQALLLIQHLSAARNLGSDRFYRTLYESLLDPRLITSSKQALYLNLLLRALKNDVDVRRVKAFAKRMLQVAGLHQPPFVCGLLYVVSHLRQTFPDLSTLVESPEESVFDDEEPEKRPTYDGRKRNPEHSNAHRSCLWEVIPMQSHFHPAVSKFASSLLDRKQKMLKPDMESHTLIRFLDKFVYRNAKASDSRGASIMQPLKAAKDIGDIWLGGGRTSSSTTQVNSAAFWNKKPEDVAAEDVFFHKYFQHVAKEGKQPTKKASAAGEDGEEDAEEDEIWKALVNAQPDIDEDASDAGFDDMDDLDMASDDDSSPALSLDEDDDDEDDDVSVEFGDEDDEEEGVSDEDDGLVAPDVPDEDEEKGDKRKARRKMLKGLPTFASVDDYAELLAGEEDL
ncbi:CBF/Mak21 family domain-containing protein [Trichoderma longibrachiatum]